METTEVKKRKNGGYYLKKKIAKLEDENKRLRISNAEKDGVIDEQASAIKNLQKDLDNFGSRMCDMHMNHLKERDELLHYMGWLRRRIYWAKHKQQ